MWAAGLEEYIQGPIQICFLVLGLIITTKGEEEVAVCITLIPRLPHSEKGHLWEEHQRLINNIIVNNTTTTTWLGPSGTEGERAVAK